MTRNKPGFAALLAAALALILGVSALCGCFAYAPQQPNGQQNNGQQTNGQQTNGQQPQQGQSAIEDLYTVPPDEATQAPASEPAEEPTAAPTAAPTAVPTQCPVREDGRYDTKDEVALYIHLFGHLPSNYIKKSRAQELGWTGGSLEPYAPGCSIGGDRFGNYEGLLPRASGRYYTECDIGTKGKSSRGAKRIVFSNDGLIYYTGDHYDSFTLLYGGD